MATPNGMAQRRSDKMPIENRELAVGTVLVARYKKQDRTCAVVETPDGVRYRLDEQVGNDHRFSLREALRELERAATFQPRRR